MIFVDTSGWFASATLGDPDYAAASSWMTKNTIPLITTDYIVDETLTLLRTRRQYVHAMTLGQEFFDGDLATIYYLTEEDIRLTWETFERFTDKDWSFTDCSSKVIIDKLKLTHAFTFDHHFRQFGSVIVVPE